MKLRHLVIALAATTALTASAYAADTIKVGLSGPFTGGSASMGVSMRDGVKLATEEINKAGGVLGKQIQLVERDDEAKNELGVQIAQELINKEQVVATLGYIRWTPGAMCREGEASRALEFRGIYLDVMSLDGKAIRPLS